MADGAVVSTDVDCDVCTQWELCVAHSCLTTFVVNPLIMAISSF